LALGKPEQLNIELTGLKPNAPILVETLDKTHGNAMAAWEAMGSPESPTREQAQLLRQKAAMPKQEHVQAGTNGCFKLRRPIEPWSVVMIREL
jgi:xylan 1,4-beta-xylosidase